MNVVFNNSDLAYMFEFGSERGKPSYPPEIVKGFIRKIVLLLDVQNSDELRQFKGARFEKLSGDLTGYESIRINDQYRILLQIRSEGSNKNMNEIAIVHDIVDYY